MATFLLLIDRSEAAFPRDTGVSHRAKGFYGNLGWRLDADFRFDNGFRVVQYTPPGSGTAIQFGSKLTTAKSGSADGLYLVVPDIEAARNQLAARDVEVSEVFHPGTPGAQFQLDAADGRIAGPPPDHASYRSFATFSDPDGNRWLILEVTTRLPGRVAAHDVHLGCGSFESITARRIRTWRTRKEDWTRRPNLARLVCRVHGARRSRRRSAAVNRSGNG